jgi:ectoine hydroxylase-related dioxygenase (phytanoyl-CoA dioxygenase family)
VIVYNGSLWHGGGDNDSASRRVGIVVNHCAGYMRQEENQLLAVPREMAATFPRRLQEMLGYGVYRGLMGHVDKQDPGVFLDPDIETDMVWKRMR